MSTRLDIPDARHGDTYQLRLQLRDDVGDPLAIDAARWHVHQLPGGSAVADYEEGDPELTIDEGDIIIDVDVATLAAIRARGIRTPAYYYEIDVQLSGEPMQTLLYGFWRVLAEAEVPDSPISTVPATLTVDLGEQVIDVSLTLQSAIWDNISGKPETATRWPGWDEIDGPAVITPRISDDPITGTVTVTEGEAEIVGAGTSFAEEVFGGVLRVDGVTYTGFALSPTSFIAATPPAVSAAGVLAYSLAPALDVRDADDNPSLVVGAGGGFRVGTIPAGLGSADALPAGGPIGSYGLSNRIRLNDGEGNEISIRVDENGDAILESDSGYRFFIDGDDALMIDASGNVVMAGTLNGITLANLNTLSPDAGNVLTQIPKFWVGTQEDYDAIGTPNANTIYHIVEVA